MGEIDGQSNGAMHSFPTICLVLLRHGLLESAVQPACVVRGGVWSAMDKMIRDWPKSIKKSILIPEDAIINWCLVPGAARPKLPARREIRSLHEVFMGILYSDGFN
jgi:hypothetical protein